MKPETVNTEIALEKSEDKSDEELLKDLPGMEELAEDHEDDHHSEGSVLAEDSEEHDDDHHNINDELLGEVHEDHEPEQ